MAAAETRRLLEQLMGEQSMSGYDQRAPQLSITDPKVCRSYLVGNCPHDLFTNTKNELGPCAKVHNEALKTEYQAASAEQKRKWGFDFDYMRDMQHHIDSCNRKIEAAQRRLEKTPEEIRQTNALLKAINELSRSIDAGLFEIKLMGEQGMVNMAVQEFTKVRLKKAEKEEKERELRALSDTGGSSGHQKLQVCDVCGAYLSRLDNDRRLADHFYGKMHLGYAQMRKSYEALQKELKGRNPPPNPHPAPGGDMDGPRGGGGWRGGGYGGGGYGGGRDRDYPPRRYDDRDDRRGGGGGGYDRSYAAPMRGDPRDRDSRPPRRDDYDRPPRDDRRRDDYDRAPPRRDEPRRDRRDYDEPRRY